MKRFFLLLAISSCTYACCAQTNLQEENATPLSAQQLENITEKNADNETEDDSYLQEMIQYLHNPININFADEEALAALQLLTPLQAKNIIRYRIAFGRFINIYELQAVPGLDPATLAKIKPYITVAGNASIFTSFKKRLKYGDRSVLFRASQTPERSAGYLIGSAAGKSYYEGSPQKLLIRYRYNFKNLLQYGFLGEKDAGEQFFKGKQKQGFDFYSAHFFMKNAGIIKSLALGDYTVNMGQGLIQWMSLAFKKSTDITSVKREADILRPYNSAGEINFHRGAGITLANKKFETTLFISYRHPDANFASADTVISTEDYVTSFQTSGYHRTPGETADKGVQRQLAFGGNLTYNIKELHLGINAIEYQFKYPLIKQPEPYNLYALNGKNLGNYSLDYSYTYRNMHFFGEAATSNKNYHALISGILISAAAVTDISIIYRNISRGYQSLYTNAFTENSSPSNEKGLFAGITIRPSAPWRMDAYFDAYKFPWLKYRVNAPSAGMDYEVQFTYKPDKLTEIYTRFHAERKSINYNPELNILSPVTSQPRQDWRTQVSYRLTQSLTVRSRAEALWFDKTAVDAETGFLIYADLLYKPGLKPYSGNIRLQYFETGGYNSRLYAYEDDVLYSYSIPVFYGKGYRYYLNINYHLSKKLEIWLRSAQYLYPQAKSIGSYLDRIAKNHKTEIKIQFSYKF